MSSDWTILINLEGSKAPDGFFRLFICMNFFGCTKNGREKKAKCGLMTHRFFSMQH